MSRLDKLMKYYEISRQAGHTTFMLEGLDYTRPAIILFANHPQARYAFDYARRRVGAENLKISPAYMRIGNVRFLGSVLLDNDHWYKGVPREKMMPIIVDHYAMQEMIRDHTREYIIEGWDQSQEGDNAEYWSDTYPGSNGKSLSLEDKQAKIIKNVLEGRWGEKLDA